MKTRASCDFCYAGHRKCDRNVPSCNECKKAGINCKYATESHTDQKTMNSDKLHQNSQVGILRHKNDHYFVSMEEAIYKIQAVNNLPAANMNIFFIVLSSKSWRDYLQTYLKVSKVSTNTESDQSPPCFLKRLGKKQQLEILWYVILRFQFSLPDIIYCKRLNTAILKNMNMNIFTFARMRTNLEANVFYKKKSSIYTTCK